jgi:hypothetical protein
VDGPGRRLTELLIEFRPARHPVVFSLAVATVWAVAVAGFGTLGRLFGAEDERPTWGEVLGATAGYFAIVFVVSLVVSLVFWVRARRAGR